MDEFFINYEYSKGHYVNKLIVTIHDKINILINGHKYDNSEEYKKKGLIYYNETLKY